MTLSFYHSLFLFFSPIFKAQRLKTFKKPSQSFVCKMSIDISTYKLQCFSLYRRSRTFLAPNALQLFQRRSGTSKRTLCIFSQDVAERPIALKVLRWVLAVLNKFVIALLKGILAAKRLKGILAAAKRFDI